MAIAYVQEFEIKDGDTSTTNYDAVNAALNLQGAPEGLLIHTAGFDLDAGVFRIFDVWETREHGEKFIEERLGPVAILIEPRPSRELVEEGIDARILGLFEGATSEELSGPDAPLTTTRILVFSHNLGDAFAGEPEAKLRAEVRVTVLHEVGHFFGLEEDDMERLGLE
jgi:predicted Zn-dependent protease with MMP-like domain